MGFESRLAMSKVRLAAKVRHLSGATVPEGGASHDPSLRLIPWYSPCN